MDGKANEDTEGQAVRGHSADDTALPWVEHELRRKIVNELHARPFEHVEAPRRLFHFAALSDEASIRNDLEAIAGVCRQAGLAPPADDVRHFRADLGDWQLRWERHTEFTSHTWHSTSNGEFLAGREPTAPPLERLPLGGRLLVAIKLDLVSVDVDQDKLSGMFDAESLCRSLADDGAARITTDFKIGLGGFTRILIENHSLGGAAAGQLVQRLLEIETYRTLALLGLPEAVDAGPEVSRIESELTRITIAMNGSKGLDEDHDLLGRLTYLAAELEAQTSAMSFRLGAGRAYHHLIEARLDAISEEALPGFQTWAKFLSRRLTPAMRTCTAVENRQEALSQRLSRAANLLRTRLDAERANQNNTLLESMNSRVRLQLRLQQTVEGLSVAAVSYYVVGLIAYVIKGGKFFGLPYSPQILTAVSVPVVVAVIWMLVRRIRRLHPPDSD